MNHEQWLEQADVYAAGALDGQELAGYEAHLAAGCAICAERIRETREALTLLPRALPAVPPPSALRARVLGAIAAERAAGGRSRRAPAPAPPEPRHLVGRLGGARRGGRAPRRRQRRAPEDAAAARGPAGAHGDAPDGAHPARGGAPVPVGPERPLREPRRAQAHTGGERVATLEPGDAAGSPAGAGSAGGAGGPRLRALGPRGFPARARGGLQRGRGRAGALPSLDRSPRATRTTPSRSPSSRLLACRSPPAPCTSMGRCSSGPRSWRGSRHPTPSLVSPVTRPDLHANPKSERPPAGPRSGRYPRRLTAPLAMS